MNQELSKYNKWETNNILIYICYILYLYIGSKKRSTFTIGHKYKRLITKSIL